jgi:hypothetical protein
MRVDGDEHAGRAENAVGIEYGGEGLSPRDEEGLHPAWGDGGMRTKGCACGGKAEADELGNKGMLAGEAGEPRWVEGVEVAPPPSVADALLGVEEILSSGEHGYAGRGKEDEVGEARAKDVGRCRIGSIQAWALGDAVDPSVVVVRLKITEAGGGADAEPGHLMEQVSGSSVATNVGGEELAEAVVPASPAGAIELGADMTPEAPGLGDENFARGAGANLGLDLAEDGGTEELSEVETDTVGAEHGQPMQHGVGYQSAAERRLGAEVIAAAAEVAELARGIAPEPVVGVERVEQVGRAEVIEDEVNDDGHSGAMTRSNEVAEGLRRTVTREGVGGRWGEGRNGHVTPVVFCRIGSSLEFRAREEL